MQSSTWSRPRALTSKAPDISVHQRRSRSYSSPVDWNPAIPVVALLTSSTVGAAFSTPSPGRRIRVPPFLPETARSGVALPRARPHLVAYSSQSYHADSLRISRLYNHRAPLWLRGGRIPSPRHISRPNLLNRPRGGQAKRSFPKDNRIHGPITPSIVAGSDDTHLLRKQCTTR